MEEGGTLRWRTATELFARSPRVEIQDAKTELILHRFLAR